MRAICFIAALCFSAAAPLSAADAPDATATAELLCTQPWQISGATSGGPWFAVRAFKKDGTFATEGAVLGAGTWKISGKSVVLTFADKHTDTISLPLDPDGTDGTDAEGKPTNAVQVPPPVQAASPEMQRKAADVVSDYGRDIVMVAGKESAGSGFIAAIGKLSFLVTNAHVATGVNNATYTTLDETVLRSGAISVAADRDVFCMSVPVGGKLFEIMQDVEKNAAVGDDVVVLGNADGLGVVNLIMGQIVKIEPDRIEVNAPFIPGNSGSPIVHLKSGKVIGIATFHRVINGDAVEDSSGIVPRIVRRYGYRLDNIKVWQTVEWRSFYTQSEEMKKIEAFTRDLYSLLRQVDRNAGKPTPDSQENQMIEKCIGVWESDEAHTTTAAGRAEARRRFLANLWTACQVDIAASRPHMTYTLFQGKLATQWKGRQEMFVEIQKIVNAGN